MKHLALALCTTLTALPAVAQDYTQALEAFFRAELAGWSGNPVYLDAARAQNATTAGYSAERIAELDRAWMAEIGAPGTPTITAVLNNAAADALRAQVAASGGRITEVILMDSVGLNVAVSSITSDYWQGDEAKFTQTYLAGPDALHISEIELDESTGRYQGQISFPLVDPATGDVVGAMTVGVDAESLL